LYLGFVSDFDIRISSLAGLLTRRSPAFSKKAGLLLALNLDGGQTLPQ
jgi:hypothetical protein